MRSKFRCVFEGTRPGNPTLLNKIYTELYITEGDSGEVNFEHETIHIETAHRRPDVPIKCNDMFNKVAEEQTDIRMVMTMGVAGIGKTISVQKFILDWADGGANQDVHLIFPLPFRELNLMKDMHLSLTDILHYFFTETKQLSFLNNEKHKLLFIFDGLDECRLPLNFQSNESLSDVRKPASIDTLLTNLIKGNLLPSALIWITSRPGATKSIPPECIDRLTEIRGFNDSQKLDYFKRKITNVNNANTIITHIKSSRSLFIMCHIPVFCWILATVFENMLFEPDTWELPKTLTQMYIYFLIFQTQQKNRKYSGNSQVDLQRSILLLGKLAFHQLEKGNIIFYEEDIRECDIDITDASVYSGVFTQIFREEFGMHLGKVYCFVHLSIQEFLAALYVSLNFVNSNVDLFSKDNSFITRKQFRDVAQLHKNAIDKALASENGHLDLFVRFLMGLSLESNQCLLNDLLSQRVKKMQSTAKTIEHIKNTIRMNPSAEKSINLFHCLSELNDHSLVQEVQHFVSSGSLSKTKLYPIHWSALVFLLRTSEDHVEEFDLKKYIRSEKCLLRLLPAIKCSKKALLSGCNLTHNICTSLAEALHSSATCWRELDLSNNNLQDIGLELLSAGLENLFCKLEILRLMNCNLTYNRCVSLAKLLEINCYLKELELGRNMLQDSGVKLLCTGLENQNCKLEKLGLSNCGVKEEGYAALAQSLKCSHLQELDLRGNDPGDTGVKLLFALFEDPLCKLENIRLVNSAATEVCNSLQSALGVNPLLAQTLDLSYCKFQTFSVDKLSALLEDPHCRLKTLKFNYCNITEEDCAGLASCLSRNSSHLRELDLSENEPGEYGIMQLFTGLMSPQFHLENIRLKHCGLTNEGVSIIASAINQNPSYMRELDVSENKFGDEGLKLLCAVLGNTCRLEKLVLSNCRISDEGCVALLLTLSLNHSYLRELYLGGNRLGDVGVKHLSAWFKTPSCQLEKIGFQNCNITYKGAVSLASAFSSNPSHLRELDLSDNRLGDNGTESLSSLVMEPNCKLERIKFHDCGLTEGNWVILTSALTSNPCYLRKLDLSFSKPEHSGIRSLSALMKNPAFKLDTLKLTYCGITEEDCIVLISALLSQPEHLREIDLSGNKPGDLGVKHVAAFLENPNCKLERMRLRYCSITEESCSFVASAVSSKPSHLTELDLTYNHTGDSGVKLLSEAIRDPTCKLEILKLNSCSITDKGYGYLAEALRSNPSHIRELDLSLNEPGDSGMKRLCAVLKDQRCKLKFLRLFNCGITETGCGYLASAIASNPAYLRELDLRQNRTRNSGLERLSALLSDSNENLKKLQIKSFRKQKLYSE